MPWLRRARRSAAAPPGSPTRRGAGACRAGRRSPRSRRSPPSGRASGACCRRSSISADLGRGIGRRVEVRAIGRLDPALQRQRAPAPRRPRVAEAVAPAVLCAAPATPKDVADDHGAPRHRALPDRRHRAHALLDGARPLGLEPDQEAGAVHEVGHRADGRSAPCPRSARPSGRCRRSRRRRSGRGRSPSWPPASRPAAPAR